jgi:hypothetical protein
MRVLRGESPIVEQVGTDTNFLGKLGHWTACLKQLNGLRFEFGCVSPTWLLIHGHGFCGLVVQKSSSPQLENLHES